MPKNYYNVTHWKKTLALLNENPDYSYKEISQKIGVLYAIAKRMKTDFNKIQQRDFDERVKNIKPLKLSRAEFFNIN